MQAAEIGGRHSLQELRIQVPQKAWREGVGKVPAEPACCARCAPLSNLPTALCPQRLSAALDARLTTAWTYRASPPSSLPVASCPQRLSIEPEANPPTSLGYRIRPGARLSQPCLATSPVRSLALPPQAPAARAFRTSRTFSHRAHYRTRMQDSGLVRQEGAQSLCTFRTQHKRNRTTYLPPFPKKTSPS